jgi:hypothetical protein
VAANGTPTIWPFSASVILVQLNSKRSLEAPGSNFLDRIRLVSEYEASEEVGMHDLRGAVLVTIHSGASTNERVCPGSVLSLLTIVTDQ